MTAEPLAGLPAVGIYAAFGYSPLTTSPTWRDITDKVRWQVQTRRGKSRELDQAQPGSMRVTFDNRDRRFDPEHTGSPYYATYLNLTGGAGSIATTTDVGDITGDVTLIGRWESPDLTPAAVEVIGGKWVAAGNQRSMRAEISTGGLLSFRWSADGSATILKDSTAALSTVVTEGTPFWWKIEHDVNNGAAGNNVRFYVSTEQVDRRGLVTAWTQLGSTVTTAGTTSHFSSTAGWSVGGTAEGTSLATGKAYAFAALAGLSAGTASVDVDFTIGWGAGTSSLADDAGVTWTVGSPASITADTTQGSYVTPRVPIRFTATYDSTEYAVWRGYVSSWEPGYNLDNDAIMVAECADLMTVMAQTPTGGGAWRSSVEALGPVAWWRFGETSITTNSTAAADVAGLYNGAYTGDTPTATTGIIDDDDNGALSTGTNGIAVLPSPISSLPATVVGWFKCPTVSGTDMVVLGSSGVFGSASLYVAGSGGDAGKFTNGGAFSSSRVDDNEPHMFANVSVQAGINPNELYIDGGPVSFVGGGGISLAGVSTFYAGIASDGTLLLQNGVLDEFAVFDRDLTEAEIADLYEAGATSWAGETTSDRVQRAATVAGVPSGLLDLDTGVSTVEGWSGGTNTLAVAQAADLTEQGVLFVSGDGKLTFLSRSALRNLTSSFTVTEAHFVDYESDYSESWIINYADFSSTAGTGGASDTGSINRYGRTGVSRTTIDDTQTNLAAGAQNLVEKYADPKQRVTGLTMKADAAPSTLWPQVLGREIGDRVTFTRTPMGTGSAISQELIIVGVEHTITESAGWVTRWNLSQADTGSYWKLDDPVYGVLDAGNVIAAF